MNSTIEQLRLATRVSALVERAAQGIVAPVELLHELRDALQCEGAALAATRTDGTVGAWFDGLDASRARRLWAGQLEPPALTDVASAPVSRLEDAIPSPERQALAEELETRLGAFRLLRMRGERVSLHLVRFEHRPSFSAAEVDLFRVLLPAFEGTADALAGAEGGTEEPLPPAEVQAFSQIAPDDCPVPLVLVDAQARVRVANRAALRKLDIIGDPPTLPVWMHGLVRQRLQELESAGGIPDGSSGDYQFVQPEGRRLMRLGLVPVESENCWLLSLEHGGPTADERVARLAERCGLSNVEQETLLLLTDGMTNAQIAEDVNVAEATVKYRLGKIMEKTETRNRTELLATVLGPPPKS